MDQLCVLPPSQRMSTKDLFARLDPETQLYEMTAYLSVLRTISERRSLGVRPDQCFGRAKSRTWTVVPASVVSVSGICSNSSNMPPAGSSPSKTSDVVAVLSAREGGSFTFLEAREGFMGVESSRPRSLACRAAASTLLRSSLYSASASRLSKR